MSDAIRYGVMKSYLHWREDGKVLSPIDLRREIKSWFDSNYHYAKHHINPVCRSSTAILRSFGKNNHDKKYPQVNKLAIRLDSELVKIVDGRVRITMRPGQYEFIPINTKNKKWEEYSKHRIGEVLITDRMVAISFLIGNGKEISDKKIGMDLNFSNITETVFDNGIKEVIKKSTSNIVGIQNDFSRRREKLQKHVRNQKKRIVKLKQTRGRQRKRINDALHKLSSSVVKEHQDSSFVLENLKHIRKTTKPESKRVRTYLNRWPYSQFQRMIEYKSPHTTLYVNPGGTSSECPVCGGRLKHPAWKISRCENCGSDYDRDRLSSLAITLRGLYLCGDPFPVSAIASLPSVMDEYLHTRNKPDIAGAGGTEMVYASNETVHKNA